MSVNDGGPAFPVSIAEIQGVATHSGEFALPGMSLRDYFAAHALAGILAAASYGEQEAIAAECYKLADALLAAREKATS